MKDVRAVLFDMDGTLVDSDGAVARSWKVWADRNDVDHAELLRICPGLPAAEVIRHFRPQWTDGRIAADSQGQLELEYADLTGVLPAHGTPEVLAAVAELGLPWAVVTSADRKLAGIRLGAADIDAPVVVTRDDVTRGKPHPDGFLLAARLLGVEPAHCLAVEDAAAGVASGRAAGMRVAGLRGVPSDVPIEHLGELADLLRGVLAR
ncbi:sugar phosphatase [Allokutzneria multivorans]|uniref:Sugar phosphatase n=1 Tax=Allokutzneria multivorans TaxID=1142134 RepID=A0ABP7S9L3_9PSEU